MKKLNLYINKYSIQMKRIKYPERRSEEYTTLMDDYKKIFKNNLQRMQTDWVKWQNNNKHLLGLRSVEDILIADTDEIAEIYEEYNSYPNKESNSVLELESLFKYDKYSSQIADFFIRHAKDLDINTCYYCDMAYINVYSIQSKTNAKRQFDLDHFIPQSKCPILALSLFNFIPSCQVCNSRLKQDNIIGKDMNEWKKYNPAGKNYNFDQDVKIRLKINSLNAKDDDYSIKFERESNNYPIIDVLHLEERYDFHKAEAIRLKELKERYPTCVIRQLANMLTKSEGQIREDLYHEKFISQQGRCFSKLTRDILADYKDY